MLIPHLPRPFLSEVFNSRQRAGRHAMSMRIYSSCKAAIGSRRAARRAGSRLAANTMTAKLAGQELASRDQSGVQSEQQRANSRAVAQNQRATTCNPSDDNRNFASALKLARIYIWCLELQLSAER
jgi:hypothetical protein